MLGRATELLCHTGRDELQFEVVGSPGVLLLGWFLRSLCESHAQLSSDEVLREEITFLMK